MSQTIELGTMSATPLEPHIMRRTTSAAVVRAGAQTASTTLGTSGERTTRRAPEEALTQSLVEEFFECTVEELHDDGVRLSTCSSGGELGDAWLPMSEIPEEERRHLALGAPVRIAIILNRDRKTHHRQHEVRVLRQSQWRAPLSSVALEQASNFILQRMKALLEP